MNTAVTASEKAAILDHYKTTVESFDAAAKQAILGHLQAQVRELDPVPVLRPFGEPIDPDEWREELQAAIDNAQIALGRAERALHAGNTDLTEALIRVVAADLAGML